MFCFHIFNNNYANVVKIEIPAYFLVQQFGEISLF